MGRTRNVDDPAPWSPEEDAILTERWPDPDLGYPAIAKLLTIMPRTEGAIKHRGHKLGLGSKAKHRPPPTGPVSNPTPWPNDMPNFENHPGAPLPGPLANAEKWGRYFLQRAGS